MELSRCPQCGLEDGWDGNGCNNCSFVQDTDGGVDYICPRCHQPTYNPKTKKCGQCDPDLQWSEDVKLEPDEPKQALPCCPICSSLFDGWDCKACGYALPEKHRKMHPKVVLLDEAAEDLDQLDRELDVD